MGNTLTLGNIAFGPAFKDIDKFFVGFDDQFNRIAKMHDEITKNIPNYPPYNIYKTDENKYVVELAVAGFGKQDIEIEFDNDKLIVKGKASDDASNNFLYKGIATRAFTRTFALDDQMVVQGASLLNGMLKIALERIIPEHKKARKVEIQDEASTVSELAASAPQLLTESDVEAIAVSTEKRKTKVK